MSVSFYLALVQRFGVNPSAKQPLSTPSPPSQHRNSSLHLACHLTPETLRSKNNLRKPTVWSPEARKPLFEPIGKGARSSANMFHRNLSSERFHFCFETFHSRLLSWWAAILPFPTLLQEPRFWSLSFQKPRFELQRKTIFWKLETHLPGPPLNAESRDHFLQTPTPFPLSLERYARHLLAMRKRTVPKVEDADDKLSTFRGLSRSSSRLAGTTHQP